MSLTPESTAESAMNSASKACAIRRASVVLPEPGGPHRIIECGLPDSKARRSGLPGAEQMLLADDLVERARPQLLGERRRGRRALPSRGFGLAEQVSPQGRRRLWAGVKRKVAGVELRIAHHVGEAQHRGLAEMVDQFHRLDAGGAEAQAHALEAGFLLARLRLQPLEAVLLARLRRARTPSRCRLRRPAAPRASSRARASTRRTVTWFRSAS